VPSATPPPLSPGSRIGAYEILSVLGAGGMGEVYRARDIRLQRDVALKVLPSSVADDPDRLARFRREAQVLASLNHPHIGAIFGVEDSDRVALVLELVDGVTLQDRIAGGPLPWKEAVGFAMQIADGLEAAHERGIVHRDLKPANIKITSSGRAKVLDFGLAKPAAESAVSGGGSGETAALTAAHGITREGMVVGTIGYMSPEQARGQAIDKRTDVWAFGCVLFEMLSGRAPFAGNTPTDTLAAIVEREPTWSDVPRTVPGAVVDVLRRCVAKDPRRRFHDLADVRIHLEDALIAPAATLTTQDSRFWLRIAVAMLALVAVTVVITGVVVRRMSTSARPEAPDSSAGLTRLTIVPDQPFASVQYSCAGDCEQGLLAISPDGRQVVYVGRSPTGQQLYVRPIDRFESRPIPGTEGAIGPVFSPDGRMLAFVVDRALKTIALDGGSPVVVRDGVDGNGLQWATDGHIYFAGGRGQGIWRVPASGGPGEAVTSIDTEFQHRFPELLPDGTTLLFTGLSGVSDEKISVISLSTKQRRTLVEGVAPHYLPAGYLVYVLSNRLMAVRFDPKRLEIQGTPVVMVDDVEQTVWGEPQVALSSTGVLAYLQASGSPHGSTLVWVTPQGQETATGATGRPFVQPHISPDGRTVAVALRGGLTDVWVFDLARETWTRLTFDGHSANPLWTPDGKRLTFTAGQDGPTSILWKAPDNSEADVTLVKADRPSVPLSWAPDGRTLAFVRVDAQSAMDIWTLNVEEKNGGRPFLQTRFREGAPAFSPDGRWIAYASDESGKNQIYVRPFPGPGQTWTISTEGGNEPVWPRRGDQLFYRNGDAVMAVDVRTAPEFSAGKPRRLFEGPYERTIALWPNYDVTPDGQRLLMIKGEQAPSARTQIDLVQNWLEDLKQRAP
jgi:eukaryotic-like serine/threonine-protein kinase